MHVVRHAARPVTFAAGVTGDRGQIRVKFRARAGIEQSAALLRAENDVDDNEAQGLWHGDKFRANGPADASLGQRPRNQDPPIVSQRQWRGSSVRKGMRAVVWRWGGLSALDVFLDLFLGRCPRLG